MNRTPVVFIHGAWLHALSWELWAERFAGRGFLALAPGWPGEFGTARDSRAYPEMLGDTGLEELTDHYASFVRSLDVPPVIIGHSIGGLIAQHLIGADLGQAAVAIAPLPINDVVLPDPQARHWQAAADIPGGPPVSLSRERFRDLLANTVGAEEAAGIFERYAMPTPRSLLTDLAASGAERHSRAVADIGNVGRGPLLLISGQQDRLVPDSVTRAVYKQYGDSTAVTELKQFADRGHSLVVDGGWRLVADYVLGWLNERAVRPTWECPGAR
ncbi:alpha/beta fold hydrolase [Streptomyces sp. NPDC006658]|uniref:alpha/beta hydrolase n=1 Tax=Streptomyces sp. NPDC006658 TaxID=3156900 RepID=UPI0033D93D71